MANNNSNFNKQSTSDTWQARRRYNRDHRERLNLVARTVGVNDGQFLTDAETMKRDEDIRRYNEELDRRYP